LPPAFRSNWWGLLLVGHQILTPGKPSGADMGQLTPLYGAAVASGKDNS